MDNNKPEPTFEESIKEVMQTLPPPIRNYLVQGRYTAVAKGLMAKYSLRIDQAGVLEREIMLLLMGIENPDEFAASLKSDASLADDVVRNIMGDVNQQIFIPLREEMRKMGPPPAPANRGPEIPSVQPEAGPGQPKSYFHLQNKIPVPISARPSARPALRDVLASITRPSPNATAGTAKTPSQMDNEKLLEDHEEPHIEFHKAPTPPVPPRPTPPRPIVPPAPLPPSGLPPAPRTLPPAPVPSNLPGAVQPRIIPPGGRPDVTFLKPELPTAPKPVPPAMPQRVPPASPNPVPPPAPKPYAADPYREPIEP